MKALILAEYSTICVIQNYEGLVYMDFSKDLVEKNKHGEILLLSIHTDSFINIFSNVVQTILVKLVTVAVMKAFCGM